MTINALLRTGIADVAGSAARRGNLDHKQSHGDQIGQQCAAG
jgi:hypothetical protein